MKTFFKLISLSLGLLFLKTKVLLAQTTDPDVFLNDKPFFQQNIGSYISTFLEIAMIIGALACLAMLLLGGISWITSSGDKNKLEEARGRITAAIIGIAILASVLVIWVIILKVFGLDNELKVSGIELGGSGGGSGGGATNTCNGGTRLANGCCDNVRIIYCNDGTNSHKEICSTDNSCNSAYYQTWSCCTGL